MADDTGPWRELAEIADALLALPEDDFAARAPLVARRNALRELARSAPMSGDDERSDEDLRQEAASLEAAIEAHVASRIDLVQQAGSSLAAGAGADGWGGVQLNRAVDEAQGVERLQDRLRRIRRVLDERGA
jgi:hypothetical protein